MHNKIVFFSNNKNKVFEIKNYFTKTKIEILNLQNFQKITSPEETGASFEENASIKSMYGFNKLKLPCFADDSGICVEALDNLPGIRSKDFFQEKGGYLKTLLFIIDKTEKLLNKKAYFQTTISLNLNAHRSIFFSGVVEGKISNKPRGQNGFGYDPIFIPDGCTKTFAEMSLFEKNKISHRSIAIKKLKDYLVTIN